MFPCYKPIELYQLKARYVQLDVIPTMASPNFIFPRVLIGNVKIGTPGVEYRMLIDFGIGTDTFVLSEKYENKRRYFPGNSSSYTRENGTFEITQYHSSFYGIFAAGPYAQGTIARDTFEVTTEMKFKQGFGMAQSVCDELDYIFSRSPIEGVLSMASVDRTRNSLKSFVHAILQSISTPFVNIWVETLQISHKRTHSILNKEQEAIITFGDIDRVHCLEESGFFTRLLPNSNWAFNLRSIRFINRTQIEMLNLDGTSTDIVFIFDDEYKMQLSPADYIVEEWDRPGKCILSFMDADEIPDEGVQWYFLFLY
ncbi:eukaryotic aspartyl protease domain-containing protein [Ditylenchus destructor]|uniref:Eukaryotic aspartyl protease domain-containing protein n=1 Tax=Ditylenchus destructor TaxID=166010 RepID=A0AAD4NBQ9_9BILA|nr:eukaryotic aspartyl protease domain-containing protein [Ditylenchus destructor]